MAINKFVAACAATATILMSPLYAGTISGTVTDTSGKAVDNARVYVEGSNIQVYTNKKGEFIIENIDKEHLHLHVYSSDHVHGDREYSDIPEQLVADFVLRPTQVENVLVTASALTSSVLESSVPVSILEGDALKNKQAPTLGETLSGLPGVHSTYFGPVASSPIIRGTDGPRVKIVQNGLDISDASRVGPDHNPASEASTATQIEVLRGPATLQYGSGAIGGVVNVVDQRIPTRVPKKLTGEAEVRFDTVSDEEYAKVDLNAGVGISAFHLDAFTRETENYEIPGFAESTPDEGEEPGTLENSAIDTHGFTIGTSLVGEQGYIGIAYQRLENLYGIPGHGHEEEEEEPHAGEEEPHEEEEEEAISLDVEMDRYQISGEWFSPLPFINSINLRSAYTEYQHVELEGEEIGTLFTNDTVENRLSLTNKALGGWHGVVGLHQSHVDFSAVGEEAFTPRSDTQTLALYVVEEKRVGDFILELGGRVERTELEVEQEVEVELEGQQPATFTLADQDFTSVSLSAGTVWNYQQGYSLSLSLTRSERAPSHQELFSAGPHISTRTFDLGAVFTFDNQGNLILNEQVEEEIANNIDVTWRKYEGSFGLTVSLFYNQVDDYLFQSNTGLTGAEELPVFINRQEDATLYGMESELSFQFNNFVSARIIADYINAELDNDEQLPRTPPLRIGTYLDFDANALSGNIGVNWYDEQDDIAPFETATDGYTLVEANVNYRITTGPTEWTLFLRGHNLTDEEARPHTSFIKDQAPLPGRGFALGVRANF